MVWIRKENRLGNGSWRITSGGFLTFCVVFAPMFLRLRSYSRAGRAIQEASQLSRAEKTAYFGFVAMEYNYLILNRTFVIFVAPEALYG